MIKLQVCILWGFHLAATLHACHDQYTIIRQLFLSNWGQGTLMVVFDGIQMGNLRKNGNDEFVCFSRIKIIHVSGSQRLGSSVVICNATWNGDMIIAHCLAFCLHYMLSQWFRNHAECERKPIPKINIYDWIICQHLQNLAGARTAAEARIGQ